MTNNNYGSIIFGFIVLLLLFATIIVLIFNKLKNSTVDNEIEKKVINDIEKKVQTVVDNIDAKLNESSLNEEEIEEVKTNSEELIDSLLDACISPVDENGRCKAGEKPKQYGEQVCCTIDLAYQSYIPTTTDIALQTTGILLKEVAVAYIAEETLFASGRAMMRFYKFGGLQKTMKGFVREIFEIVPGLGQAFAKKLLGETSEEIAEKALKSLGEDVMEKLSKELGEEISEKVLKEGIENLSEKAQNKLAQEVYDKVSQKTVNEFKEKIFKEAGEQISREVAQEAAENAIKEAGEKLAKEAGEKMATKLTTEAAKKVAGKAAKIAAKGASISARLYKNLFVWTPFGAAQFIFEVLSIILDFSIVSAQYVFVDNSVNRQGRNKFEALIERETLNHLNTIGLNRSDLIDESGNVETSTVKFHPNFKFMTDEYHPSFANIFYDVHPDNQTDTIMNYVKKALNQEKDEFLNKVDNTPISFETNKINDPAYNDTWIQNNSETWNKLKYSKSNNETQYLQYAFIDNDQNEILSDEEASQLLFLQMYYPEYVEYQMMIDTEINYIKSLPPDEIETFTNEVMESYGEMFTSNPNGCIACEIEIRALSKKFPLEELTEYQEELKLFNYLKNNTHYGDYIKWVPQFGISLNRQGCEKFNENQLNSSSDDYLKNVQNVPADGNTGVPGPPLAIYSNTYRTLRNIENQDYNNPIMDDKTFPESVCYMEAYSDRRNECAKLGLAYEPDQQLCVYSNRYCESKAMDHIPGWTYGVGNCKEKVGYGLGELIFGEVVTRSAIRISTSSISYLKKMDQIFQGNFDGFGGILDTSGGQKNGWKFHTFERVLKNNISYNEVFENNFTEKIMFSEQNNKDIFKDDTVGITFELEKEPGSINEILEVRYYASNGDYLYYNQISPPSISLYGSVNFTSSSDTRSYTLVKGGYFILKERLKGSEHIFYVNDLIFTNCEKIKLTAKTENWKTKITKYFRPISKILNIHPSWYDYTRYGNEAPLAFDTECILTNMPLPDPIIVTDNTNNTQSQININYNGMRAVILNTLNSSLNLSNLSDFKNSIADSSYYDQLDVDKINVDTFNKNASALFTNGNYGYIIELNMLEFFKTNNITDDTEKATYAFIVVGKNNILKFGAGIVTGSMFSSLTGYNSSSLLVLYKNSNDHNNPTFIPINWNVNTTTKILSISNNINNTFQPSQIQTFRFLRFYKNPTQPSNVTLKLVTANLDTVATLRNTTSMSLSKTITGIGLSFNGEDIVVMNSYDQDSGETIQDTQTASSIF